MTHALIATLIAVALTSCSSPADRFNARVASEVERKNGPDGDERCTAAYQRRTNWRHYADDAPDCPGLSPPA